MINWKLEQISREAQKERKLAETDIVDEEKQKVFDIMFKLNQTSSDETFDCLNSATSLPKSAAALQKGKGKAYQIEARRNKVAATKFLLQDVLGKYVIPITTILLVFVYIVAVLALCV